MAAPAQPRMQRPGARAGARFFSPETWRIDPLADALAARGPRLVDEFMLDEHNEPDKRLIASMLRGHAAAAPPPPPAPAAASGVPAAPAASDPRARRLLLQLALVHEAISSAAEFGRMRAAISESGRGDGAPGIAPPLPAQG